MMHSLPLFCAHCVLRKEWIGMDRLSLLLVIVGAVNWGLVGLFQFDLIAFLFGGQASLISRVLYTVVGAAGIWSISMLFAPRTGRVDAPAHAEGA